MREFDIALEEVRFGNLASGFDHALAEKSELVAEILAVVGFEISCEIPPLRFEVGVCAVVLREAVIPTRQRHAPLGEARYRTG